MLLISCTDNTHPVDSKSHNYVRFLVNDFSFSSRVAQICLYLKMQIEMKAEEISEQHRGYLKLMSKSKRGFLFGKNVNLASI